jgi:mono/diheme cytochrome c family protein
MRPTQGIPVRLLLALILAGCAGLAQAASLSIDTGHGTATLSTQQLLARPDLRTIDVPGDVSYKKAMRYKAVPLKALLAGVPAAAHLQFTALDGFAAEIPAALVLDGHGAEAWLAVEDATWPALGDGKPSAGPFYLVWLHPEAGKVGPEQWPYQIASIRVLADPALRFPLMRPAPGLANDSPVMRGFEVFQKNCITCHTLNGQGDAKLGPDLNIPHSPTEYLREGMLRVLVRNPQTLRHWPQAKMPGFSAQVVSDADLANLEAYLKHMAGRKATP